MIEITSTENQVVKHLRKLSMGAFRKKCGETVLEGERLVNDVVTYGGEIDIVLVRENYAGRVPACRKLYKASARIFDAISETKTPQGILATAKSKIQNPEDLFRGGLVVFCDRVQDPGNLGTIFRTAHAVGADGVVLMRGCAEAFAPKTVRASMGSAFAVPIAETECFIKPAGYMAFCGMLSDKAKPLYQHAFPEKTILILGNEANGASDKVLKESDAHILIPMPGGAESLNVAAAGAVMMYEYIRQVRNVY